MKTCHALRSAPAPISAVRPVHRRLGEIAAAIAAVLLALGTTDAQAHAHIHQAVPAPGNVVREAPDTIALTFNEAVEPAFSTIEILDARGAHVEVGKARSALDDARTLRIGAKLPGPGVYWVLWRVLSVDTHRSNGNFTFTLAP